jgi:hypothetical protein
MYLFLKHVKHARFSSKFLVGQPCVLGIDPLGTIRKLPVRKKKSDSY